MKIEYTLIRSRRKTMAIQVKEDGQVVLRAPMRISKVRLDQFVQMHADWILDKQKKFAEAEQKKLVITEQERRQGMEAARQYIPQRAAYFAAKMGVSYNRITIREQKTRWGSCSGKGNLNFNWKLMLMPREILDYVVVHELAHRKEMNHSPRFWQIVEAELPDYRERRAYLKKYGTIIS